jgi:hypothetical protein
MGRLVFLTIKNLNNCARLLPICHTRILQRGRRWFRRDPETGWTKQSPYCEGTGGELIATQRGRLRRASWVKLAWMLPFAAFCAWVFFDLGSDFTEAAPIFLTCSGKRTEITGSKWGPPGSPEEKVTGTDDVTVGVKIDPDMQTFAWSENPLAASWPHCKLSKQGEVEQPSGNCTYIFLNDILIIFTIVQPPVPTGGTIDRVTGEMYADQNLFGDRHKRWNMTCSPTKQKF